MTLNVIPFCMYCKRLRMGAGNFVCDAFPDRIPDDIFIGGFDHRNAHEGDNGILFELSDLANKEEFGKYCDYVVKIDQV
jgi:hypothetical protein